MAMRTPKPDLAEEIRGLKARNPEMTHKEIAAAVDRNERTVRRYLEDPDRPKRPAYRPWTDEEDEKILTLLRDNTGYAETARTVGRDKNALARRFPGYGMERSDIIQLAMLARKYPRVLR